MLPGDLYKQFFGIEQFFGTGVRFWAYCKHCDIVFMMPSTDDEGQKVESIEDYLPVCPKCSRTDGEVHEGFVEFNKFLDRRSAEQIERLTSMSGWEIMLAKWEDIRPRPPKIAPFRGQWKRRGA